MKKLGSCATFMLFCLTEKLLQILSDFPMVIILRIFLQNCESELYTWVGFFYEINLPDSDLSQAETKNHCCVHFCDLQKMTLFWLEPGSYICSFSKTGLIKTWKNQIMMKLIFFLHMLLREKFKIKWIHFYFLDISI